MQRPQLAIADNMQFRRGRDIRCASCWTASFHVKRWEVDGQALHSAVGQYKGTTHALRRRTWRRHGFLIGYNLQSRKSRQLNAPSCTASWQSWVAVLPCTWFHNWRNGSFVGASRSTRFWQLAPPPSIQPPLLFNSFAQDAPPEAASLLASAMPPPPPLTIRTHAHRTLCPCTRAHVCMREARPQGRCSGGARPRGRRRRARPRGRRRRARSKDRSRGGVRPKGRRRMHAGMSTTTLRTNTISPSATSTATDRRYQLCHRLRLPPLPSPLPPVSAFPHAALPPLRARRVPPLRARRVPPLRARRVPALRAWRAPPRSPPRSARSLPSALGAIPPLRAWHDPSPQAERGARSRDGGPHWLRSGWANPSYPTGTCSYHAPSKRSVCLENPASAAHSSHPHPHAPEKDIHPRPREGPRCSRAQTFVNTVLKRPEDSESSAQCGPP